MEDYVVKIVEGKNNLPQKLSYSWSMDSEAKVFTQGVTLIIHKVVFYIIHLEGGIRRPFPLEEENYSILSCKL